MLRESRAKGSKVHLVKESFPPLEILNARHTEREKGKWVEVKKLGDEASEMT